MPGFTVFAIGALFALGLAISGMTLPQKVIAFLDVGGDWDPSLAMVMVGAIATYTPLFHWVTRRKGPVFASLFRIPQRRDITPPLVGGAFLFGVGWAVGGLCPGPALASVTTGAAEVLVFIGAMLGGMVLHRLYDRARTRAVAPSDSPAT